MDFANGRCDAKEQRFSWKMPTSVNSLTVQIRRSPLFDDLVSVLKTQGIGVETHDGSDVYSLAMLDGRSPIDEESFQSEVLKVLQRFKCCWTRFLRATDKKPRSVGVSNSTLQMGNFLDHGSFIAQHQMKYCSIRLDGRQIELCLEREFYLQFLAHEMEDFVLVYLNECWFSIFLTLRHPPRLSRGKGANLAVEERTRVSELLLENQDALKSASFARCKTYRLIFERRVYHSVVEYFEFLGKEVYYSKLSVRKPSSNEAGIKDLSTMPGCHHSSSWEVNLAWLCVMSSPGFVPERFTPSFFKRLNGWNARVVVRGLYWLAQMMNKDHFVNPNDHLDQFPRACAIRRRNQNLEDNSNNCRIPRLVITPTRLVFFEPEIINSNRILRNWSDKTSFLKVSVRDENLEKLSRSTGGIQDLLKSLFDQMKSGFDLVGGKQFRFLGCSNNQVRDHGCFFVDVSSDAQMAEEIRKNCGNLDYIKNVAKYISRLGQAFSTSIKTVNLKPKECEKIPDIESNGYIFTDGIGKISPDLAIEVRNPVFDIFIFLNNSVDC